MNALNSLILLPFFISLQLPISLTIGSFLSGYVLR